MQVKQISSPSTRKGAARCLVGRIRIEFHGVMQDFGACGGS